MSSLISRALTVLLVVSATSLSAADWPRFRGSTGMGTSDETNLPVKWSSTENIAWKVDLPGPGSSSPITSGNRVFVTCYSGYGVESGKGEQEELRRHLLCLNRNDGAIIWQKTFEPKLPEHKYQGEGAYQGYAGSTPLTDG